MKNQNSDKKSLFIVAYTTPGWPLSHFPNGIVTYVHNILYGFDSKTDAIVLAAPLIGAEVKDKFVNLSQFLTTKNLHQKLGDKVLSQFNWPFIKSIQYQRASVINAKKIHIALQKLSHPLDVLEMEESFGTAHFLLKMTKTPIVTRIHGPWFTMADIMRVSNDWDFKLRVFYEGEAIKNAHGVTAPSLDVLSKVREYYGIELPNAKVIPNPVPEVVITKRWQLETNKRQSLLFVVRFDLHKGGDLMLDAFRLIALKNSEIELLFVGPDKGVDIDGTRMDFNQYRERFIPETAIKNRIHYLGQCDHSRIAELRQDALITVVCSRYETFSISLAEALAVGSPVVAANVGAIKELITDGFNGVLAEPESAKSIADKVLSLINEPEKMQRLSKNAIEDCKKRFSPEVVAAQTLDYYQSVLARVPNATK